MKILYVSGLISSFMCFSSTLVLIIDLFKCKKTNVHRCDINSISVPVKVDQKISSTGEKIIQTNFQLIQTLQTPQIPQIPLELELTRVPPKIALFFDNLLPIIDVNNPILHNDQKEALKFASQYTKNIHNDALTLIKQKLYALILTDDDIFDTIDYMRNLSIVIHFGKSTFFDEGYDWLKTETNYKSVFESKTKVIGNDIVDNWRLNNLMDYQKIREFWEKTPF